MLLLMSLLLIEERLILCFCADRGLTVDELHNLSLELLQAILYGIIAKGLGYEKLSAHWVPKKS